MKDRLNLIKEMDNSKGETIHGNKTLYDKIFTPLYHLFLQLIVKSTSENKLTVLNKKLEQAGLLKYCTKEKWIFNKLILSIIAFLVGGLLMYTATADLSKCLLMASLCLLSVNPFLNFYIARKITIRKKQIVKDLPYTLDLITVSVGAGLSFDGAMARVVANIKGELCDEFAKCLKETRMGIQRKVALRSMGERCDVNELSMFITAIIQADELGVSISKVLRIEADNLREKRKQTIREKAMKAPIKMLFPLIFFIFPSIFIILLGPVLVQIIDVFSGM